MVSNQWSERDVEILSKDNDSGYTREENLKIFKQAIREGLSNKIDKKLKKAEEAEDI